MPHQYTWSSDTTNKRLSDTEKRIVADDPELKFIFTQTFFEKARLQVKELNQYSGSFTLSVNTPAKIILKPPITNE
mgnify:CR=1 FL=1